MGGEAWIVIVCHVEVSSRDGRDAMDAPRRHWLRHRTDWKEAGETWRPEARGKQEAAIFPSIHPSFLPSFPPIRLLPPYSNALELFNSSIPSSQVSRYFASLYSPVHENVKHSSR